MNQKCLFVCLLVLCRMSLDRCAVQHANLIFFQEHQVDALKQILPYFKKIICVGYGPSGKIIFFRTMLKKYADNIILLKQKERGLDIVSKSLLESNRRKELNKCILNMHEDPCLLKTIIQRYKCQQHETLFLHFILPAYSLSVAPYYNISQYALDATEFLRFVYKEMDQPVFFLRATSDFFSHPYILVKNLYDICLYNHEVIISDLDRQDNHDAYDKFLACAGILYDRLLYDGNIFYSSFYRYIIKKYFFNISKIACDEHCYIPQKTYQYDKRFSFIIHLLEEFKDLHAIDKKEGGEC